MPKEGKTAKIILAPKAGKFLNANRDKRFLYLRGGAGSAKSWSVAADLVTELVQNPRLGLLALRKTKPSVRTSCLPLTKYWLDKMRLEPDQDYKENKSDLTITFANKSFIKFDSIDDVEKKKSIEGINKIWFEEATEFRKKEVMQLNLRCRAANPHGINQLIFSYNPIDPVGNEWLFDLDVAAETHLSKIRQVRDSARLIVTHLDNPFLSEAEREVIEELADQDEEYNKIYRLGMWATPTNLIYSRWDIIREMTQEWDDIYWGLDFGYVNPSALLELRFLKDEVWEREHIYESGLTTPELIVKMKIIIPPDRRGEMIIADSAEPKTIQEIKNAGFNIIGCKKGPDSVAYSIRAVQAMTTHLHEDSVNLIKEKRGYKWQVDKNDEVVEGKPVCFNDHLMAAERYAIMKVRGNVKAGITFGEDERTEKDLVDRDEIWDDFGDDE